MSLLPHQERVVFEAQELNTKINALFLFVQTDQFTALPEQDRSLLNLQLSFMRSYETVLKQRIARFT